MVDKEIERVLVGQCDCVVVPMALLVDVTLTLKEGEKEPVTVMDCVELTEVHPVKVKDTDAVCDGEDVVLSVDELEADRVGPSGPNIRTEVVARTDGDKPDAVGLMMPVDEIEYDGKRVEETVSDRLNVLVTVGENDTNWVTLNVCVTLTVDEGESELLEDTVPVAANATATYAAHVTGGAAASPRNL